MLFDAVVRYGQQPNTCYGLRLGEPVPNAPYATIFPIPYSLFPIPYSLFPLQ
ncbi:hypothetical protein [Moorena producens]|uniref:hypothetical protein n=1 Tax=Moorena producens TaxID=1155739 RepID=UPI000AA67231|nr:hypothetical protein [Moorena producens]